MILRNIEKFEVHTVILNFRTVYYFIAHSDKYSLQIFKCYLVRVLMTSYHLLARKSYVDGLSCHLLCEKLSSYSISLLIHFLFYLSSYFIYKLSDLWSLFRSKVFHSLKYLGKLTLFSENRYLDFIQCFGSTGFGYSSFCFLLNFFKHFFHIGMTSIK